MDSIGLTVNDNQVVMLLLRKGLTGDPFLENYRLGSLGEVNPEDREEILLSNLEGFIDQNKGDRDNLFLSIPGNKVIFKRLSLPSPTEENLKEVLGFEMDRVISTLVTTRAELEHGAMGPSLSSSTSTKRILLEQLAVH